MSPFVIVNQPNHSVCIKKPSISNMLNSDEDSFPDILGSLMQVPSSPEHAEYGITEKKARFLPLAPINDAKSPYSPPVERKRTNSVGSENEFQQSPLMSSEELEEGSYFTSPISSGRTTPFIATDDESYSSSSSSSDMVYADDLEIKAAEWLVNLSSSFSHPPAPATSTIPVTTSADSHRNKVLTRSSAFPVLNNITNITATTSPSSSSSEYIRPKPRTRGMPVTNNTPTAKATKKRLRIRTTPYQLDVLKAAFLVDTMPNSQKRISLAKTLGMTPRRVQVWFQNQRAKEKRSILG